MPITPKVNLSSVPIPKIPWFKQYLEISFIAALLITALTAYFGWQAKDMLFYPRVVSDDLAYSAKYYQDQQVTLKGFYLPLSLRQKPLCSPEGGTKQYPDLRKGYQTYPATWGISNAAGNVDVAVRIIDQNGQELNVSPEYEINKEVALKGTVRLATTLDDCNKDLYYETVYLEVTPESVGIKQK